MRGKIIAAGVALLLAMLPVRSATAQVDAEKVRLAIESAVRFLKKQQVPHNGSWPDYPGYKGGITSLCTLALLSCGFTPKDPAVEKALRYLKHEAERPDMTYTVSLRLMVYAAADPGLYRTEIESYARWLEGNQIRNGPTKGSWSYSDKPGHGDNSNTQFAILGLHEAERAGIKVSDQTWQLALQYWLSRTTRKGDGAYSYEANLPETGSMTGAAVASLILATERVYGGDARVVDGRIQCCGGEKLEERRAAELAIEQSTAWLGRTFATSYNPTADDRKAGGKAPWRLYYLYGIERVGRMSGQRMLGTHDWYREGAEFLVADQPRSLNGSWTGTGLIEENNQLVSTSLALLFLSKGRRPVVLAKLKYPSADWDLHRRAVPHLTARIEKQWRRDLSWQTIDLEKASVPDLQEAPVLFMSGAEGLAIAETNKDKLKEFLSQGGFLMAEACDGDGCHGGTFDRDFRKLMAELFPESPLRRLPPDHAVWYAQESVNPQHLPKDDNFWLWGLDTCCRTSVIYCPRSLSCRWELGHPYREASHPKEVKNEIEACLRLGGNIVAYATNRQLKEKLDRPQLTGTQSTNKLKLGALAVPKLVHGGGSDDAPNALNNLLLVLEKQFGERIDYRGDKFQTTDPRLLDYPLVFAHGRRAFRWSAAERRALKDYLDRGGLLFADAICASHEFADALRSELKALYPEATWQRLPPRHPLFTEEFQGFSLDKLQFRDPQSRAGDGPLEARATSISPVLETLEVDGRIAVILSPYDISCALEKGASLECKGYTTEDAARLGANIILYALQQ